jgi:cobalt-zinc-cadmium resistance protein CzcA
MRDVATVQLGSATRYGAYIVDGKESVGGVVMMLKNANSKDVVKNVETKMNDIQKTLPAGVSIEPYLNRADLIGRTIHTIAGNLIEGALIVIFVLILFIGNIRGGFIVASVIPLSMMFAFVLMNLFGVSGNLMSLGAIDFGMIVDGAVIIVDCVVEKLTIQQNNLKISFSQKSIDDTVRESTKRMMSSAIFGQIIIFIVYLPIISLVGIEGKMFRPMAEVVSFALIGAAILSLTYVPVASSLLLRRKKAFSFSEKLMSAIRHLFVPIINFSLRHKVSVFSLSLALFVSSLVAFSFLGGEFIPQLEEGDLAASVVTLQGGSLSNTITQAKKADSLLRARFPEIKHIVCKIGTGEIPNDPMPFETGDLVITLTPKKQWTSAKTTAHMEELMQQTLAPLAGVQFEFQQPIQIRQNELLSGSKQDVSIKIFGDDMDILSTESKKVKRLIHDIPGVTEVVVEQVTGLAQVHIVYNRDLLAEYGVSIADVNDVLRAAFAGSKAGTVYEGEKRFDLVVRFNPASRTSIEDVCNIPILLPNGMQMPLNQLADVYVSDGPSQVSRENTHRRIVVGFNVRGADVETVVNNVQSRLSRDLQLPSGYYITLGGEFKNLQDAKARLVIAVPIALISIFILLYFAFHSVREALLIYSAVPMSIIGGIWALWFRNMNFSISAGVGFIALFGIAVLNGIVLVSDFNKRERNGERNVVRRVVEGVNARLRPVFITAVSACLGFLPMAVSSSAGAEVQKPLATVVIGGLITSTLLTLVLLPVLYIFFNSLKNKRQ